MAIWAIADLHLSFNAPKKSMEAFGEQWANYTQKIKKNWEEKISADDLILIAGDISWSSKIEDAQKDFLWIDSLPGTKVIIRGNHDYWWQSYQKVKEALPPSIRPIQNDVFIWKDVAIGGARLWDSEEYNFESFIDFKKNPYQNEKTPPAPIDNEKIYKRELERLKLSFEKFPKHIKKRIAITHYPPIGGDLSMDSSSSKILEEYFVNICIFGHLHSVKKNIPIFGEKNNIQYILTSCDFINFSPVRISFK